MDIQELLSVTESRGASDLHILAGYPPSIRVDGEIIVLPNFQPLDADSIQKLIFSLLGEKQRQIFQANKSLDLSISSNTAHYRVNFYYQKGLPAAAFRLIPRKIPTIEELHLPKELYAFTKLRQGFVLITGPTGHGKTTTQAALINEINKTRASHIVTIEDPIEYIYPQEKAIVSQREMNNDTFNWHAALRDVLREDPDVVLVGEMRDLETIRSAITIAETGHLVFATLHTNSAAQSVERIIDVFPPAQQELVRIQLAQILEGVVSQRLVRSLDGGRVPAVELLLASSAVKSAIREEKTHQLDNIIQTSGEEGMYLLETDLARLVSEGKISIESAKEWSLRPGELVKKLGK